MGSLSHFCTAKPALAVCFAPRCNKQRLGCTAAPDEPHYLKPSRLLVQTYSAPTWRTEDPAAWIFDTPLNGAKLLCRISSGKFFSEAESVSR